MTLTFSGGPIDGYFQDCPLAPPPAFFLPTSGRSIVSVYRFSRIEVSASTVLQYAFDGYKTISDVEAQELFASLN